MYGGQLWRTQQTVGIKRPCPSRVTATGLVNLHHCCLMIVARSFVQQQEMWPNVDWSVLYEENDKACLLQLWHLHEEEGAKQQKRGTSMEIILAVYSFLVHKYPYIERLSAFCGQSHRYFLPFVECTCMRVGMELLTSARNHNCKAFFVCRPRTQ